MPSFLDQIGQQLALVQSDPQAFAQMLKQPPRIGPEGLTSILGSAPLPLPAGVLAPTANPFLQRMVELLRQKAPELVGAVERSPRTLFNYLMPGAPARGAVGTYQTLNPLAGQTMVSGLQGLEEGASTLGHEMQHFLTDPFLAAKPLEHAQETTRQLAKMLPTRQANPVEMYAARMDPLKAFNESLSYLTEALMKPQGGDPMLQQIGQALLQQYR